MLTLVRFLSLTADKLTFRPIRPAAAPQLPRICAAHFDFVPCASFRNTTHPGTVAALRDSRRVGRRLVGAGLSSVRADSRI